MSGDLSITKATPSLYLRSKSGTAHVWFQNEDQSERGVIFAPTNTDTLGEVHIRAKNTKGESSGDFIVRHDGRVEARDLKVTYKISGATAELANTSTDATNTTLKIRGAQHTPLVLTRNNTIKNVSIGFKVDDVDQKYLGIAGDGDLYFGSYSDHTKNSKVITQAKLDSGVTVGGKTTFSDLATFSAGISGVIEPESISEVTVDLNNLTIKGTDKGSVKYYQCRTAGGGANITNKPAGIGGNFLLRVESIRKITDSDYTNLQTIVGTDTKQIYVRYCENGNWSAWSQIVVSGRNQDVTVRSLTSTTPSKLGGGRIDVLGSTSDYGSMNCTVRGVDSTGTNSAWSVGTSESTGKKLFLKNHRSSAQVLLNGDDGAVQLLSGTVNGATAQALTINKDE
ncbi:pyocin knob domain-containing protein, partial [Escherichia coli]